jgi:hypothetical protein
MKIKTLIAILFTIFALVAFSNTAFSQTKNPVRPPLLMNYVDKSSSLPGISSTRTVVIVGVSVVAAAAVVVGVLVIGHKKHHNTTLNTGLSPNFNINYYTSELNTGLNPNFDLNLVFNNNLKGVGVRYAFR